MGMFNNLILSFKLCISLHDAGASFILISVHPGLQEKLRSLKTTQAEESMP